MEIGNTIRTRRRQKDMTQEQLAEKMSVSISAVSQWECGKSIPDLTMVPALCSVLDISADELLGVDQAKKKEQIQEIVEEARKVGARGYTLESREILIDGLRRFPDSHLILCNLMYSYNKNKEERDKARELAEKLLAESHEPGFLASATQVLTLIYRDAGETEKAEEIVDRMGDLYTSRNVLKTRIYKGAKAVEANRDLIEALVEMLVTHLPRNYTLESGERYYSSDEMAQIHTKIITILETIFENGDYGFEHCRMQESETELADYYAEKQDGANAILHLRKAADHAIVFVGLDGGTEIHTSLLYRGMEWGGFSTDSAENNASELLEAMGHGRYDFLRETDVFRQITAELEQYAGQWSKPE